MDPLINNEKIYEYIYLQKKYISYQLKSSSEYNVYMLVLNIYCNIFCSLSTRNLRLTRKTSGEIWHALKLVWPSEQLPGISLSSWVCSPQSTPRSVEVRDCHQQKSLILLKKYYSIITISGICLINKWWITWVFKVIHNHFTTTILGNS